MKNRYDSFEAIADSSRRQILVLLGKDTLTINSLAKNFNMSRPAVSKHIKILELAGLILINDAGRERYCKLNEKGLSEIKEWLNYFETFWENKLQKLNEVMDEKEKLNHK